MNEKKFMGKSLQRCRVTGSIKMDCTVFYTGRALFFFFCFFKLLLCYASFSMHLCLDWSKMIPWFFTPEILCIKQFLQHVQDAKWSKDRTGMRDQEMRRYRVSGFLSLRPVCR